MKILDKISQWRERNITIHKVYNNGFQLLSEHPITNFQLALVQTDQLMLTAKELHALEQTAQWMDPHHQDVFYQNQHPFQNTTMIQKLEDLIKPLVILLILIKFQCQHHIQDKTPTTSHNPKEHQLKENLKKYQSLILQSLNLTQLSTDKMKKV